MDPQLIRGSIVDDRSSERGTQVVPTTATATEFAMPTVGPYSQTPANAVAAFEAPMWINPKAAPNALSRSQRRHLRPEVRWRQRVINRDRPTSSTPYLDATETVACGIEDRFRTRPLIREAPNRKRDKLNTESETNGTSLYREAGRSIGRRTSLHREAGSSRYIARPEGP
jgi:hypothetical protein